MSSVKVFFCQVHNWGQMDYSGEEAAALEITAPTLASLVTENQVKS